jgi:hypothetical protein
MSVHLQIAKQINTHLQGQKNYKELDSQREEAIEEALQKAKNNEEYTTQTINEITEEINGIAKRFAFPLRKVVTKDMISNYAK